MRNNKCYGVGINDADFATAINKKNIPSYEYWRGVLRRCYSELEHQKRPLYKGCTVCEEWLYFTNFHRWFLEQDVPKGWQIDKDILNKGNKHYSPENCVFVEQALNTFLTDCTRKRGEYKIGVFYNKKKRKFIAQCQGVDSRKKMHLGNFDNENDAYVEYMRYKHEQAMIWVSRIKNNDLYKRKDELCQSLSTRFLL